MSQAPTASDEAYQGCLDRLAQRDLQGLARAAGLELREGALVVPFFREPFLVGPGGARAVQDTQPGSPVSRKVQALLCQYLLRFPGDPPKKSQWAAFRELPGTLALAGSFTNHVEKTLNKRFGENLAELSKKLQSLGGRDVGGFSYDLAMELEPIAHLWMLVLANEGDEDFPAFLSVLFDRAAATLLDPESLAILGWTLADRLVHRG